MARPGEESVRVETGRQVVYPTIVRGGLVDLCSDHKKMFEGYSNLANQIAEQTGLGQDEHATMTPHEGTCAECARRSSGAELANQLNLALPPGYLKKQDQSDRRPRKPFTPGQSRTKPLPPLPQSLNTAHDPHELYNDPERWSWKQHKWDTKRPEIEQSKDHGWFTIHAEPVYDDGDRQLHAVTKGGQYIGETYFGQHPTWPGRLEGAPEVHPDYRRRGVGSAMYDYASELGGAPMAPSDRHTDDAEAFWRSRKQASHDELKPLPEKLYHVTTARDAVLEHGLKNRQELGQQYGHGLGGGRDNTISLTTHRPTAEHLLHSLHEYHDVLNGKITPDDLIEKAKNGVGANKPFHDLVTGGNDYYQRAKALEGDRTSVNGVHVVGEQPEGWEPDGESIGDHKDTGKPIHMYWTRPVTDRERTHARSDLYKSFTWGRQFAGGHMDPLFIQNDPVEFAKKDPSQFALLHVRAQPGAHGIRMNNRERGTDAGEWRAMSGKDLDVTAHDSREDIPHRIAARARVLAAKYPIKYTRQTSNGYEDVEDEIEGPLYHGSRSKGLDTGDMITTKRKANSWGDEGPKSQHVFFTQHYDTAKSYADQAGGHVYEVEPTGEFKHDYSSGDYKTKHPLKVVRVVPPKTGHMGEGGQDPFEASHKTAALKNPIGGHEWYHGTPYDHGEGGFTDPAAYHPLAFEEDDYDTTHWNTLLGNHFTADHKVAEQFARTGSSSSTLSEHDDDDDASVLHAKLHMKRPKVYKSEYDMDQEVHEFEHGQGNHIDHHIDEKGWDEYPGEAPHSYEHKGDSERGPYTKNEWHKDWKRPMATHWLNTHPDKFDIAERYKDRLIKQGYDGVVYGNEFEKSRPGAGPPSAIAFHPHQIEITQRHHPDEDHLSPEDAEREQNKPRPYPGQMKITQRLPFIAAWDDDDEWTEDETHYCPACGEDHDDEETRDNHMTAYTDWDQVHPKLPDTLHRGMAVSLPHDVHEAVHDESRPVAERAKALADHVSQRELGMHWSDNKQQAAHYSHVYHSPGDTHVIVHARKPEMHHIETDPDELESQQVIGYGLHDDNEIPIRSGAPVHATGISWKHEDPEADWHTHHFGKSMEMTGMRKHAHDSGDSQRIYHCPFCGGGQVIGRSDGTTECEFCGTHFTVQVQPTFNSFPQTDPETGMPIQIPGMPGQIDGGAPMGMDPSMPPGAPGAPPGVEPGDDSGNPFGGGDDAEAGEEDGSEDDGGDDDKPDFLKSKGYRTASGDVLTEAQYLKHLALLHAPDKETIIEVIRRVGTS